MQKVARRTFLAASLAAGPCFTSPPARERFRLAVTTDEIDDDLLTAVRFLNRFGLGYAELRNIWGKYNTEQPLPKIREARRLLDDHGIKTAILDTSFFKIPLPDHTAGGRKTLDEQWALLERAMERADILGTDKIRTFAFVLRRGQEGGSSHWGQIVELVAESVERAAKQGLRIALENVGGSYVSTARQAASLLEAVPNPNFGLTWDPNNSARSGGEAFPGGYARFDPKRVFHVHLRDYCRRGTGEMEWCGVGEGEFDHLGQLRALLRDGYHETLSLETHYRIDGSKTRASEASLRALLEVMDRV